ncbi:MAG: VPDSG-CTERM sorting domain-containing protein [Verrucomicrobiota bacterium]|nr:VPDSG-CTERM sorting domain-containing protein [Verrucomicrobiota bacterium]
MKLSKTILAVLGTAALMSGMMSQSAQAIPINGSIGFNGSGFGTQSGGTSTLTFNNPMTVDIRQGDYTGIPTGTSATFAPISWTGSGTSAVLTSSNSPEWTIVFGGTTYQFSLLSLTSATLTGGAVSLQGNGIATIAGAINRDPTFASFSVQGTGNNFTFTIVQSSTSANGQAVPDGGSAIALLGVAVMGIEVLRRKLRTA